MAFGLFEPLLLLLYGLIALSEVIALFFLPVIDLKMANTGTNPGDRGVYNKDIQL